jgi:hypothetical protein
MPNGRGSFLLMEALKESRSFCCSASNS